MSLLLEALKKAEKAKEEAQRRAKGADAPAAPSAFDPEATVLEEGKQAGTERLLEAIEEELGRFRRFADVPSVEIEEMAARIARAIAPIVGAMDEAGAASRAA